MGARAKIKKQSLFFKNKFQDGDKALNPKRGLCDHRDCQPRTPALPPTMKSGSVSCSVVSHSFATPWSVSHQAPLSMGFPRQEYWSGLPCPSPRDLPELGIGTEAGPRAQQADFSPV